MEKGLEEAHESLNFIEHIIEDDLSNGKHDGRIQTRFPPEPNGYLHLGHAKSICLNFGLAKKYNGACNLRFDDTNPEKESQEYVDAIKKDIQWLGFEWSNEFYASDYFETLYDFAVDLIKQGHAYVDDLSAAEISEGRGNPTKPGTESPYRSRSVEENLALFQGMRNGDFAEGDKVLRAKIDMTSPNMHLRDPIMYRIRHVHHHRTADQWCIYPNYDFAHGQSDAIEKITHSICTLEFEVHRPLYEWFIEKLSIFPSKQYEFARLNLSYTIMSKRKLLLLVEEGHVDGWDDPRMPTISGIRRRGFTPDSIKVFANKIGVARRDGIIDVSLLEQCVREDLNKKADRRFGIQDPIKLTISNFPEDHIEWVDAVNNPEDESAGSRKMPFSKHLLIERGDFMEEPPKKFFRLGPEREVRLKYGYIVKCTGFEKNDKGEITEVICEYFPETKSGSDTSGKKVKGTLAWVSESHAQPVEIRLYDRLFETENLSTINEEDDFRNHLNPHSLRVLKNAVAEPALAEAGIGYQFQFERQGYFRVDELSENGKIVLNRTVTLKDAWQKAKKKGNG